MTTPVPVLIVFVWIQLRQKLILSLGFVTCEGNAQKRISQEASQRDASLGMLAKANIPITALMR